jgi:peptide-methionine (S)-S-oxide reductase
VRSATTNLPSLLTVGLFLAVSALGQNKNMNLAQPTTAAPATELATFGGGCFWCLEALFQTLDGVASVTSGYAGGHVPHPTYKDVCSGTTGHAEVIQIQFDPRRITYEQLLDVFWEAHDPTTLNRQGPDTGTQYRSIILYRDEAQKRLAEKSKQAAAKKFSRPIVTQIEPLTQFYKAEGYHQDYYRNNSDAPYCQAVISPKPKKFLEKHGKK